MLSPQNRLKKKKDFERVFKQGDSIRGSLFFLKKVNNQKDYTRVGFIVSKKISNKAVVRNKIKRQLREATREELKNYEGKDDLIIVALSPIKKAGYKEIKKDISLVFRKIYNLKTKQ